MLSAGGQPKEDVIAQSEACDSNTFGIAMMEQAGGNPVDTTAARTKLRYITVGHQVEDD